MRHDLIEIGGVVVILLMCVAIVVSIVFAVDAIANLMVDQCVTTTTTTAMQ